ncbi:MAG: Rieske (2Fe-2S) protein [Vicinamibacterales bacterium]
MTADRPPVARRTLLDWLLGLGVGSTGLAVLQPVRRFLVPPKGGEAETESAVAAQLNELPPNSGKVFPFGSRPAIVVRTPDGELRAFSAVCTHLDCTVQYKADTSQLWCACHNGIYDLAGNNVSGPPPRPLEALKVNVRGEAGREEVVVSRT